MCDPESVATYLNLWDFRSFNRERLASATLFQRGNNSVDLTDGGDSIRNRRDLANDLKSMTASTEGCPMQSKFSA